MFGFAPMSSRPMGSAPSATSTPPTDPPVYDDPNAPGYGISTIMRATTTNRTAALDAAPLNLTASLL